MADRLDPKRKFRSTMRSALSEQYATVAGDEALRTAWSETLQATESIRYESSRTSATRSKLRIRKVWFTQGDSKVRSAHQKANGQSRFVDHRGWGGRPGKFRVMGEMLRHPRDPNGSPGNVINCRCFLEYRRVRSRPGDQRTPQAPDTPTRPPTRPPADTPQWSPSMAQADADRWAAGSALPEETYHATTFGNQIRDEGFEKSRKSVFGDGVYGAEKAEADGWRNYAQGQSRHYHSGSGDVEVIKLKARVDDVIEWADAPMSPDGVGAWVEMWDKIRAGVPNYDRGYLGESTWQTAHDVHAWAVENNHIDFVRQIQSHIKVDHMMPGQAIAEAAQANGSGALRVSFAEKGSDLYSVSGGPQVVVFDPKDVVVIL